MGFELLKLYNIRVGERNKSDIKCKNESILNSPEQKGQKKLFELMNVHC